MEPTEAIEGTEATEATGAETPPRAPGRSGSSHAASSTGDPFLGDAGPGFAPGADPGDSGPELGPELLPPELVSEEQIASLLGGLGDGAHAAFGVGQLDWVMTETDLRRIGPPLTRIVNRHPELAAVAAHSDELAVAIGAGLFTWRSLLERQAVLRVRADEPQAIKREPGPSAPAPAGETSSPAGPGGPVIETPLDYVPAAERLRATREPRETP